MGDDAATTIPELVLPAGEDAISAVGAAINGEYLADEHRCVESLLAQLTVTPAQTQRLATTARQLVERLRSRAQDGGLDGFLKEYDLGSHEGVVLMCLAEALLRIPDADTADRLIADKLASGDWERHLREGSPLLVNASTWGLMLTGRLMGDEALSGVAGATLLRRLVRRIGEPLVRAALRQAMRIMAEQFVMGRTIDEAIARSRRGDAMRYRHSFDMLGEAALTDADADRYHAAYLGAIDALGRTPAAEDPDAAPSISVKLTALHPRVEIAQRHPVQARLVSRLLSLAVAARERGVALTIDAEESERLELSLLIVEELCQSPRLDGWNGLGLAVQAYQKRAPAVIDWCADLAGRCRRRLAIRLVKGAYWDSEIKRAQERGLDGYPVFTRKSNTDVSYLACARRLLAADGLYPQFATHNAHTVASVLAFVRERPRLFEFQRLHGMGEALYEELLSERSDLACRVYAPVGAHEDLLPYLVRRLLENGANTSFVHRLVDVHTPIERIIEDPAARARRWLHQAEPAIPLPPDLHLPERRTAGGINLADGGAVQRLAAGMRAALAEHWAAAPVIDGRSRSGVDIDITNPARRAEVVGTVVHADASMVDEAIAIAVRAQPGWDATPAGRRADLLLAAADRIEFAMPHCVAQLVREAGRTVADAIAEVREAVDFLRYYAAQARRDFAEPLTLRGAVGESNTLRLHGRGAFVCLSPWNFPLAIFVGQVAAALAAGNSVIAKPAEQTPLVAATAVRLLHEAGIPVDVLQLLTGEGETVGARAVADPRIAGVAFTGSTETARRIHRAMAAHDGPIPVLIAETGGINAMIVDSSALPEQVVVDAVTSAFNSAGQRCSALRLLCVQAEIADDVRARLAGHMDQLVIGDPALLSTDIGPVIDAPSRQRLIEHWQAIRATAGWSHQCRLDDAHRHGEFFAPAAVEIDHVGQLTGEVFGPILHLVRYEANALDDVIDAINGSGYALTLGIHSRIDATVQRIAARARAGNAYVNRNMIGAVVGVQPFGGSGLSGTGPKAGGPHTLLRYASESTLTINTAAVGGNASLLALQEE